MLPRLFNGQPDTFDPTVEKALPGEIVANSGPDIFTGMVRRGQGGDLLVDRLPYVLNVEIVVTTPGALSQRVTVTVTDGRGDPIDKVALLFSSVCSQNVTGAVLGPSGRLFSVVVDGTSCLAFGLTNSSGVCTLDLTVGLAGTGDVAVSTFFPGVGYAEDGMVFAP